MVKMNKSSGSKSLIAKPKESTSLAKKSKQEAATTPKQKKVVGKAVDRSKEKSSTPKKVKHRKQNNRKSVPVVKKPKKDNGTKSAERMSAQEKKAMQPPNDSEGLGMKIMALKRKRKQTSDPRALVRLDRLIVRAKYHLTTPTFKNTLKRTPAELSAYLNAWKNDRENWKYNKQMQFSVQKLVFDVNKIDAELFPTAVEYLSGSQGTPRHDLIQSATKIVAKVDRSNDIDMTDPCYVRARQVLQYLV